MRTSTLATLTLLASAALAVAPSGCGLKAGLQNITINVRDPYGQLRRALVYVPAVTDLASLPLVLALHGLTRDPEYFMQDTGLNAVADANNFIVAYPQGWNNSWNGGFAAPPAGPASTDDTTFLKAVVSTLVAQGCADRTRVYVHGHSNGAFMAYRLACEASETFAAISAVAGNLGDWGILYGIQNLTFFKCNPTHKVPILHVHGLKDTTINIDGNVQFGSNFALTRPVSKLFEMWDAWNGCTPNPMSTTYNESDGYCRTTAASCAPNATRTYCFLYNATHSGPVVKFATPRVWPFFSLHTRPDAPAPAVDSSSGYLYDNSSEAAPSSSGKPASSTIAPKSSSFISSLFASSTKHSVSISSITDESAAAGLALLPLAALAAVLASLF